MAGEMASAARGTAVPARTGKERDAGSRVGLAVGAGLGDGLSVGAGVRLGVGVAVGVSVGAGVRSGTRVMTATADEGVTSAGPKSIWG